MSTYSQMASDALTSPARSLDPRSPDRAGWVLGQQARRLLVITMVLQATGLTVLSSASSLLAMNEGHGALYYVARQTVGVVIGALLCWVVSRVDAEQWRAMAWPLFFATALVLLIVVLPGTEHVAPRINGSRRWLSLGVTWQPSELGKLAVVIWTAMLVVKKGTRLRRITKGLLPFVIGVGLLAMLTFLEPDLSIGLTYFLIMGMLLFAANVPIGHFLALGVLGVPVLWHELERLQYVVLRTMAFFDRSTTMAHEAVNYQLRQSLVAVGSGGWTGVGYGQGMQQSGFLPFPYSDFIASNLGEEWGLLGLLAVLIAFTCYGVIGLRIAREARSEFQRLVAIGCTIVTVLTAYLHIGVVVGLLPTTGLTLPFFSYGRTNLVITFWMTGILLNIGSQRAGMTRRQQTTDDSFGPLASASRADDDRIWRF